MDELNQIAGRKGYTIMKKIGFGASADIYIVRSNRYSDNFILKFVHLERMTICKECELNVLKGLNSVYVIRLYDFDVGPHHLGLFLEYCPAGNLYDYVRNHGPFAGQQLSGVIKILLSGLDFIHSNHVSHGDIKPQNVLIDRHGRLKYADFGFSRAIMFNGKSTIRSGSIGYAAPEVLKKAPFDAFAADLWALGVMIYFVATGRTPWPECNNLVSYAQSLERNEVAYPDDVPDVARLVVEKLLVWNPAERVRCGEILSYPMFTGVTPKDGIIHVDSHVVIPRKPATGTTQGYLTLRSITKPARKFVRMSHQHRPNDFDVHRLKVASQCHSD